MQVDRPHLSLYSNDFRQCRKSFSRQLQDIWSIFRKTFAIIIGIIPLVVILVKPLTSCNPLFWGQDAIAVVTSYIFLKFLRHNHAIFNLQLNYYFPLQRTFYFLRKD